MGMPSFCKSLMILWMSLDYMLHNVQCNENIRVKRAPESWLKSPVLTESQIKLIVDKHNEMRTKVQPTAAKMLRISWSEELAEMAKDYSKKCDFSHSNQEGIGENVAVAASNNIDNFLNSIVDSWNDEGNNYDLESKTCAAGKQCNHYTQLMWESSYEVGCGISECSAVGTFQLQSYIFVCNYREGGNIVVAQPGSSVPVPLAPYKQGESCSECAKGYTCSENLCTKIKEIDTTKDIEQDACYRQNQKMIEDYNRRMRIYEEVDLKRWRKNMEQYEESIAEDDSFP